MSIVVLCIYEDGREAALGIYVLVKEITAVGDPWQSLLYCMLVTTLVNQQQVTNLAPELAVQHATHRLDLAFEDFLVINIMMVPCTSADSTSLF